MRMAPVLHVDKLAELHARDLDFDGKKCGVLLTLLWLFMANETSDFLSDTEGSFQLHRLQRRKDRNERKRVESLFTEDLLLRIRDSRPVA
jgi:hypothetical protein